MKWTNLFSRTRLINISRLKTAASSSKGAVILSDSCMEAKQSALTNSCSDSSLRNLLSLMRSSGWQSWWVRSILCLNTSQGWQRTIVVKDDGYPIKQGYISWNLCNVAMDDSHISSSSNSECLINMKFAHLFMKKLYFQGPLMLLFGKLKFFNCIKANGNLFQIAQNFENNPQPISSEQNPFEWGNGRSLCPLLIHTGLFFKAYSFDFLQNWFFPSSLTHLHHQCFFMLHLIQSRHFKVANKR